MSLRYVEVKKIGTVFDRNDTCSGEEIIVGETGGLEEEPILDGCLVAYK